MSQRLPVATVYSLDTGGCGACQQSIAALNAVRHLKDLAAQGVTLTDNPRSANIVLLTGALTATAEQAVRQTLDSVPEPKILVAVGDCANGGCVFAGGPQLAVNAAEALNVHVEVGGCPTAPMDILAAIQKAQVLLTGTGDSTQQANDAPTSASTEK